MKIYSKNIAEYLAYHGHFEGLKYVRDLGCAWDFKTCSSAALNGHLDVLKYARDNGCYWHPNTSSNAALNGHLSCLKYATEQGCPKNHLVCTNAASNGHVDCIRYAREHGYQWGTDTTREAAANGQLDCLKWLRENRCPWDVRVIDAAVQSLNVAVLEYALGGRHRARSSAVKFAAKLGRVDLLQTMQRHGCRLSMDLITIAVIYGHLDCVKYLHTFLERGWPNETVVAAARRGHIHVLEYALNNGCACNSQAVVKQLLRSHQNIEPLRASLEFFVAKGYDINICACIHFLRTQQLVVIDDPEGSKLLAWLENLTCK